MNSVQKNEHEKNLEHGKKRSRPSLLRPVSAPAKVTVSWVCRCPLVEDLRSNMRTAQAAGLGQGAQSEPRDGLKWTGCGSLGRQLTSEVAVHLFPQLTRLL